MNEYKSYQSRSIDLSRVFFRNVYTYMFAALSISGILAYTIGTNEKYFVDLFITSSGDISMMFYLVMFSPILLVFAIQLGIEKFSLATLTFLFILYSVLMGMSLSTIFLVYDLSAIYSTFFVSAGAFAGMAILGYTTSVDLTKLGSLLYMVLIGMIIASVVNFFIGSSQMDFIISCLGVFVFTGLTAYQMQQLKRISESPAISGSFMQKYALIGGLQLYILFVNLFLSLLRLLGGRD